MIFTLGNLIVTFENILDKEYLLRRSIQSPFVQENWDLAQELRESSRTCAFFCTKNIKLGRWHFTKLFSPITNKTSKHSNLPCVWFLILISFDDTWFFELHFRSPVTFHSCTPGERKIFEPNDIYYQSLWCWWLHMNSQRSLGCSWLRFSIGFRPGQIGFLNVSFLKTYWCFDQLNLTKLPM